MPLESSDEAIKLTMNYENMKPIGLYLKLLGISGILFLLSRLPYRTYIYEHGLFDFYIADTAPNFLTVFMFVFLRRSLSNQESALMLSTMSGVGVLVYEFIQGKTILFFDWRDVMATVIAALLVYPCIVYLDRKNAQTERVSSKFGLVKK